MTREELIEHLEHLEKYTHYSEDVPALREVIEILKCSEMPNSSKDFFWKNARKNARKYTETHACVFNGRCTGEKIIRCKDCKHYYYADNRIPQEQRYSCDLDGDKWSPDSFCSFAERREE